MIVRILGDHQALSFTRGAVHDRGFRVQIVGKRDDGKQKREGAHNGAEFRVKAISGISPSDSPTESPQPNRGERNAEPDEI